jgi:hypothetical protein
VATCDITPSLAANSSISPVNVAIRPVRSRRRRPAVTASRSCSRRMSAGPGRRATTATSP